ncbi:hypothetical protein NC651_027035 [Populus alba x Populus x berolinensis]|nr:hypothetical protein NC651_027035 [Populus alba x Populus x berolinensis]
MVKLIGRCYSPLQFFLYSSFSLFFAFCVFLNLFPSLCFPYALSISPPSPLPPSVSFFFPCFPLLTLLAALFFCFYKAETALY